MERARVLREQAALLRALASSFDIADIRDQLRDLATRCDELAKALEDDQRLVRVSAPEPPPDLH